jgi:hypothetical protein
MTDRLSALHATLDDFLAGTMPLSDLARDWRDAASTHEPALPERYIDVLERLLNQMESAALFTEESCSYSPTDLAGALQDWLARAQAL